MQALYPSHTRISAISPKSIMEFFQISQNKPKKKKVAKPLGYKVAEECLKIELEVMNASL